MHQNIKANMSNDKEIEQSLLNSIESYWEKRDYRSVLNFFKVLFLYKGFNISFKIFAKARSSYNYLKDDSCYQNYWIDLTPDYMRKTTCLINSLTEKTITQKEAINLFNSIIESLNVSTNLKAVYKECFSVIVNAVFNNVECIVPNSFINHRSHIICSGMGWSGSGAVIDYFKEFSNIFFIRGESPVLEIGNISFLSIIKYRNNKKGLLKNLIEFFFLTIIGSIEISNHNIFKSLLIKYLRFNDTNSGIKSMSQYYIISSILANMICKCQSDPKGELDHLTMRLGDELINLISSNVPNDKIPLLDNCIHINNLNIAKYLSSVKIVAVKRDPRSNFVTRCLEEPGFDQDVNNFIMNYKKSRKLIDDSITNIMNESNNISLINFEDFVLDEKNRIELRQMLDISFGEWLYKKKFFDDSISIRNVFNFKKFKNQDQITKIEQCLNEYLFLHN